MTTGILNPPQIQNPYLWNMEFIFLIEGFLVYEIFNSVFLTGVSEQRRYFLNTMCLYTIQTFWASSQALCQNPYPKRHLIYNFRRELPGNKEEIFLRFNAFPYMAKLASPKFLTSPKGKKLRGHHNHHLVFDKYLQE